MMRRPIRETKTNEVKEVVVDSDKTVLDIKRDRPNHGGHDLVG
jgi:hypothetical protein